MTPTPDDLALLAFDDERVQATNLAQALGVPLHLVARHLFPDGEVRLTLPPSLPPRVVVLRGLHRPGDKVLELLMVAPAARELGAQRVELVVPYLAYMRQDRAFNPGEVVSQRHLGMLLAAAFEAVYTVDPHLHRVASLTDVVPGRVAVAVSAAPLLGDWVAARLSNAVLIGPDEDSATWVQAAADRHGLAWGVGRKVRRGDRDVSVELPALDLRGRAVVLLDAVASTGSTLVQAAGHLLARGAASVDVAVTHALFVGDAMVALRDAGVRQVWSTDTVPHATNVMRVAPLLAQALRSG